MLLQLLADDSLQNKETHKALTNVIVMAMKNFPDDASILKEVSVFGSKYT